MTTSLGKMKAGQEGVVTKVNGAGNLRYRLLDMGLIPKTRIKVIRFAPMGDPMEISLRGYELTLRKADADMIEVEI